MNYALSLATQCGHMEVPRNNARAVKLNQEDHFTSPGVLLKRMNVELDQIISNMIELKVNGAS